MRSEYITSADCEIVSSRVFNTSQESMFRAWTDPDMLSKWWGPAGFTNTFIEHDPRPGGRWRFTMHGPDKCNYENEVVFLEVERPSLIAWDRVSKPLFRVVTTFDEAGAGRTRVTFRMQFASKEECDKLRKFVPDKNEENFDKLEVELLRWAVDLARHSFVHWLFPARSKTSPLSCARSLAFILQRGIALLRVAMICGAIRWSSMKVRDCCSDSAFIQLFFKNYVYRPYA